MYCSFPTETELDKISTSAGPVTLGTVFLAGQESVIASLQHEKFIENCVACMQEIFQYEAFEYGKELTFTLTAATGSCFALHD